MRRHAIAFALVASLGGCTLLTSLDGLSGGADDGGVDGTNPEGGSEGSAPPTSPPTGGDGGDSGVGDGAPFCVGRDATVCEDFDDAVGDTFAKWQVSQDDGVTIHRVAKGYSAPSALEIAFQPVTGTGNVAANMFRDLGYGTKNHFTFRFIVDQSGTGAVLIEQMECYATATALVGVRFAIDSGFGQFIGAVYPNGGAQPGTYPDIGAKIPIGDGHWYTAEGVLDYTKTPATLTATIDGTSVADNTAIAGATLGPGGIAMSVGVYYMNAPSTGWKLRFDDISSKVDP